MAVQDSSKQKSSAKTIRRGTISVTEKDIEKAKRGDSYKCVVMQAIARTFPDAHHIDVDTQTIRFTDRHERKCFLTPYAVQGYVIAFDAGDPIEPFTFQLRKPVPVRQPKLTDAGKKRLSATNRARTRARKARQHDASAPDPRAAAQAAYKVAKADYPGPGTETDPGKRLAPPRVFKTKHRTYGHRVLRINQEDKAKAS